MPHRITINGDSSRIAPSKATALEYCRRAKLTEWVDRAGFRLERLKAGVEIVPVPCSEALALPKPGEGA